MWVRSDYIIWSSAFLADGISIDDGFINELDRMIHGACIPHSSLTQVIDNISANAIYWLKLKTAEKDRKLFVDLNPERSSILIGNNDAEIAKHIEKYLFKRPFVTTKPDGHGLGMYIAGRIIERTGGSIKVIKPGNDKRVSSGVAFELKLPGVPVQANF